MGKDKNTVFMVMDDDSIVYLCEMRAGSVIPSTIPIDALKYLDKCIKIIDESRKELDKHSISLEIQEIVDCLSRDIRAYKQKSSEHPPV